MTAYIWELTEAFHNYLGSNEAIESDDYPQQDKLIGIMISMSSIANEIVADIDETKEWFVDIEYLAIPENIITKFNECIYYVVNS